MAKEPPEGSVEIRIHSRHGDSAVDPAGQMASSSTRPRVHPPVSNHSELTELRPFKRWATWLVPSIVVANVVLFMVTMYLNDCPRNSPSCMARFLGRFSFQPFKENPLLGPSASTLEKMGALDVEKVVYRHQAWRLITCIWLHAGVFHVLSNMVGLLLIGIRLEREFGFARIGMLYLISGFGGSLLSALFIRSGISVGASGALFGLLGGMLSELITNWTIYTNKIAALLALIFIVMVNLAVGILPHVDNFAHIGGFISGFLLGFVFLVRPQFGWIKQRVIPPGHTAASVSNNSKHKPYQYVLWLIALLLLIVGFTVGLIMLLRGDDMNDHCSWCHYMSCIPTSKRSCKAQQYTCQTTEVGNHQLNVTCLSNGRSNLYSAADNNSSTVEQLCTYLCS